MNWVLILLVVTTGHQTAAPALTTAQYRTEAMCQAAGVKAQNDLASKMHSVKFSCSRKE